MAQLTLIRRWLFHTLQLYVKEALYASFTCKCNGLYCARDPFPLHRDPIFFFAFPKSWDRKMKIIISYNYFLLAIPPNGWLFPPKEGSPLRPYRTVRLNSALPTILPLILQANTSTLIFMISFIFCSTSHLCSIFGRQYPTVHHYPLWCAYLQAINFYVPSVFVQKNRLLVSHHKICNFLFNSSTF